MEREAATPAPAEAAQAISSMRLVDDEFMKRALKGRAECLQLIARATLGDPTLTVESVREQEELPGMPSRHGARLDFLCSSADGRLVNVEIESASSGGFPPRRARFYSALVDAWSLEAGAKYEALADSAVVVVSEADQLGLGLQRCTVRRRVEEAGRAFDDGSLIVYVNCQVQDDTELGRLAHDMLCANPDEMYYPELASCTRAAKEMGGSKMATYWQEVRQGIWDEAFSDGKAEGLAEGLAEGRSKALFDLAAKGAIASDIAARELGITEPEFAQQAADAGYTLA